MTATVSSIWRHPIKSHGREELWSVTLRTGQTLPWDRVWAVAHEASKATSDAWSPCAGFSRVSKAPALMAITATLDEAHERICLRHPDCPELDFAPDTEAERFLAWVAPLMPADRAASARIVRVPGRGMTDSDFPSVTLCSLSSHQAVEQHLGQSLSINRWRGNIWLDGRNLSGWIARSALATPCCGCESALIAVWPPPPTPTPDTATLTCLARCNTGGTRISAFAPK